MRFYQKKMAELRAGRHLHRPLSGQLRDILAVVADCERRWALDDWIDRRIGRD
ncbi:MAG TPA: hypothetical protein VNA31_01695 [bacterium]|nr:hypothetical protein [bacterium]